MKTHEIKFNPIRTWIFVNLNEGRFCIPPNLHFSTLSFYMLAWLWKCDNGVIINVFHLTAKEKLALFCLGKMCRRSVPNTGLVHYSTQLHWHSKISFYTSCIYWICNFWHCNIRWIKICCMILTVFLEPCGVWNYFLR